MASINLIGNYSLSVFNHIKDRLVASGIGSGGASGTFIDSYPNDDLMKRIVSISDSSGDSNTIPLPVISFEEGPTDFNHIELGSKNVATNQVFIISIFAENKPQLRDLTGQLLFDIQDFTINLKDYNNDYANPPTVGDLFVDTERIRVARINSTDSKLANRNRVEILFEVTNK